MLFLLAGVCAFTGVAISAHEFSWIESLPGVTLTASEVEDASFEAVYSVADLSGTLQQVRAGLIQRGWRIAERGTAAAGGITVQGFEAYKDGRHLQVTVQDVVGFKTLALDVKGRPAVVQGSGDTVITGGGVEAGSELVLNHSGVTETYYCQGTEVVLNGNSCNLTFTGTCRDMVINGSDNRVRIEGTIGDLTINGSGNAVRWSRAANARPPETTIRGVGNRVKGY